MFLTGGVRLARGENPLPGGRDGYGQDTHGGNILRFDAWPQDIGERHP